VNILCRPHTDKNLLFAPHKNHSWPDIRIYNLGVSLARVVKRLALPPFHPRARSETIDRCVDITEVRVSWSGLMSQQTTHDGMHSLDRGSPVRGQPREEGRRAVEPASFFSHKVNHLEIDSQSSRPEVASTLESSRANLVATTLALPSIRAVRKSRQFR
jgi:hypothetical protein